MADREITNCWRPKNVQQIGKPQEGVEIYVEEYVKSFISDISEKKCTECSLMILTGHIKKPESGEMVFVTGAIPIGVCQEDTYVYFDDDKWRSIYDCVRKYFPDSEVVGWAVTGRSFDKEDKQKLKKAHVDNFGTGTRLLYICNWLEKKEQFCLYCDGSMNSVTGYFVYYSHNNGMQDFICDYENGRLEGETRLKGDAAVPAAVEGVVNAGAEQRPPRARVRKTSVSADKLKHKVYRYSYIAGILLVISVLAFTYIVKSSTGRPKPDSQDYVDSGSLNPFLEKLVTPTVSGFVIDSGKDYGAGAGDDSLPANGSDINSGTDEDGINEGDGNKGTDGEGDGGDADSDGGAAITETGRDEDNNDDTGDQGKKDTGDSQDKNDGDDSQVSRTPTHKPDGGDKEGDVTETQDASAQVRYHVVEAGETLYSISRRYYGSELYVEKIKERNGIQDEDRITAGQELILP